MKVENIRKNLALVLEDIERASQAKSEEAFDICQGLEDAASLLSDMLQRLKEHETPYIGGFDPHDVYACLGNEVEGFSLSKKKLSELVEYMAEKFDPSVGISWDTIPLFYENWRKQKKQSKADKKRKQKKQSKADKKRKQK